jgi:hypothetical protein
MCGNPALNTRGKGRFFINFRQPAYTRGRRTLKLSAMSMFICNAKGLEMQEKINGVHSMEWDRKEP